MVHTVRGTLRCQGGMVGHWRLIAAHLSASGLDMTSLIYEDGPMGIRHYLDPPGRNLY